MLAVIRVKNFAIVDEIEIEFGPGLNVITGETGAGKSIVLKAIELLSGRRASSDMVRAGEEQCSIEGLFQLSDAAREYFSTLHEEAQELAAEEELLVRRVIDRSGRTKNYVNGRLAPAVLLQTLCTALLDITGQHEHQRLLDPAEHLAFLDQFGSLEQMLGETAAAYRIYAKAKEALESFQRDSRERALHYERIKEEHQELKSAALTAGEREELERELKRLSNFEALSAEINQCLVLLDDDEGIESKLRRLDTVLTHCSGLDPKLEEVCALVDGAGAQLTEARLALADYGSALDCEPGRLEFLRERIAELARLERKYRRNGPDLIDYQQRLSAEIAEIETQGFDEKQLLQGMESALAALEVLQSKLTAARKEAALCLARAVEKELAQVNMKRARFKVEILPSPPSPRGADAVQFMLAANPGEPFLALQKVASGGELSRILLILKTLLNKVTGPETQIFDEIDSGIGGAVAQIVGEKLHAVARSAQVILVTHSPQIAAFAERHFSISKLSSAVSTSMQVRQLDADERVGQIAAMLSGKQVTSNFEQSARELLAQSAAFIYKSTPRTRAGAAAIR